LNPRLLDWRNYSQKTGVISIGSSSKSELGNVTFGFSKSLGAAPIVGCQNDVHALCEYYFVITLNIAFSFLKQFENDIYDAGKIRKNLEGFNKNDFWLVFLSENDIERIANQSPAMKIEYLLEKYGINVI